MEACCPCFSEWWQQWSAGNENARRKHILSSGVEARRKSSRFGFVPKTEEVLVRLRSDTVLSYTLKASEHHVWFDVDLTSVRSCEAPGKWLQYVLY